MNFNEILVLFLTHPPDLNAPIPLANHPATMYGSIIPFHVLALLAVLSRLYVRFRVVREAGWDDYIIFLAALFNLTGFVLIFGCVHYGVGRHLITIPLDRISLALLWMYLQFATFYTVSVLIKISLLCQYLRLFRTGVLRTVCIILLVLVSLWGSAYVFMGWFPCFPVAAFWDRFNHPTATCYGFGFGDVNSSTGALIAFSATNTVFDAAIFAVPLSVLFQSGLDRKQIGLFVLFTLGSIVVIMSILRIWVFAKIGEDPTQTIDFTWYSPLGLIAGCIEVDLAIICASIPIFWPVVKSSFNQIFVTKEVRVTFEAERDYEMEHTSSLRSKESQEMLTRSDPVDSDYHRQLNMDRVKGNATGPTAIEVVHDSRLQWLP